MSVETEQNLDVLTDSLVRAIQSFIKTRATPTLTRARHREALNKALESLNRALAAEQVELIAEDIRMAARYLGKITGRVDVEDLLDVIFRDFCLGK